MTNSVKTAALLGLLSGLLVLAGYSMTGSSQGLVIGLLLASVTTLGSWFYSDRIALAAYKAQPLSRDRSPKLYDMVSRLSKRANLPMPKLYAVPTQSPNAFATGRDPEHAAFAVTEGIVDLLTPEELEGVIAHELTHIRNRDTLTQAVSGTLGGAVTFLGKMLSFGLLYSPATRDDRQGGNPFAALILALVAPLAASLVQLAISRTREFSADAGAAQITGNPLALARALKKIEQVGLNIPINGNPAMSPLLIINPVTREGIQRLFRTHPTTDERVKQLVSISENQPVQNRTYSEAYG
ncbi:MAG: M48 family metalloprotease [Cyanobacteria bacterium P01_G01_bin.4]